MKTQKKTPWTGNLREKKKTIAGETPAKNY